MRRLSFAAISSNTHPSVDTEKFDFSQSISEPDTIIEKLASSSTSRISNAVANKLQSGSGEWEWLQNNKQSDYIDAIRSLEPSRISKYFANLFRTSATYGYLSPSFSDIVDHDQTASDILSNIDSCVEFAGLTNIHQLATPLNCGNPYGLILEDGARVLPDSPRHFYYARNILRLVKHCSAPVICEIGSGFGGLSYYLYSHNQETTTVNIDLLPALVSTFAYLSLRQVPVRFSKGHMI